MVAGKHSVLHLSSDGVFPLCREGAVASTGLALSGTIQGEGLLAGVPSLFVRLAGCNLHCQWAGATGRPIPCDTPYALMGPGEATGVEEVACTIERHSGRIGHVVLTGGEPLLQAEPLAQLIARLHDSKAHYHVTVETNGTLYDPTVAQTVDLVSLSPKPFAPLLGPHGGPSVQYAQALQSWLDAKRGHSAGLQLKFVVGDPGNETSILDFLAELTGVDDHPIFVMPLGRTRAEVQASALIAVGMALRNNWRYSPRLQVDIWGARAGV